MVLETLLMGLSCGDLACVGDEVKEIAIQTKHYDSYNPEINGIPILECNYDSHPNALYSALEKRDWDQAGKLLRLKDRAADGKDQHAAQHDAAAPTRRQGRMANHEVLARTWIVRKDENGAYKWRRLPIHAAVMFDAPIDILEALLWVHPDGAKLKDNKGNLPLHLAHYEGRGREKIELIKNAYPEGNAIKNSKGLLPTDLGPTAAMKKVKDDISMKMAEMEAAHDKKIAQKEAKMAAMKKDYEAKIVALKEANRAEVDALKEKLAYTEDILKRITEEKQKAIELALEKNELEKNEPEQRTPAPRGRVQTTTSEGSQQKKQMKSKSFFKKMGLSSKNMSSKAAVPVSAVPTKAVEAKKEGPVFSDEQFDALGAMPAASE